ncbi:hypothetical protein Tco_0870747 [Tanacetum coccineum]
MVSLYMRYSTEESRWNRYCIVVHEMLNGRVKMLSLYMRCSSEESRCLGKMILDVNFLWKEERVHLLVVSLGTSMTSRYSLRPSTSLSDSPGPYRNAECLNCKLLVGKIKVLEATLEIDSDDDNEEDAKIARELLRKANAVKDNMPDLLSDVVKKKRRQTELSKLKALADVTDKPVVDVVSEPAVKRVVEIQTESHEIQT